MIAVHRGRLTHRAEMKHHLHRRPAARKVSSSSGCTTRVGGCFARLRHLPRVAQRIGDHSCGPAPHQLGMQIRADEAGSASYQDHGDAIYGTVEPRRKPIDAAEGHFAHERPAAIFDDLAGVAGGAISALAGLREEAEAMIRARTDELIQRLDLVRREELEAIHELAANARAGQEAAEAKVATWKPGLETLEARVAALEAPDPDVSHRRDYSVGALRCCLTVCLLPRLSFSSSAPSSRGTGEPGGRPDTLSVCAARSDRASNRDGCLRKPRVEKSYAQFPRK